MLKNEIHIHSCILYFGIIVALFTFHILSDNDECKTKPDICGTKGGFCVNNLGSFTCVCEKGFAPNGKSQPCTPIDYCVDNPMKCGFRAECLSTRDGYECRCKDGYKKNARGICEGEKRHSESGSITVSANIKSVKDRVSLFLRHKRAKN